MLLSQQRYSVHYRFIVQLHERKNCLGLPPTHTDVNPHTMKDYTYECELQLHFTPTETSSPQQTPQLRSRLLNQ